MKKIGIITCARYLSCGGGKCFRSIHERKGGFSIYPPEEQVEVVGYSSCGGCPGGNIEYVPAEFVKNGCDTIHLATGFVVGYPPCPHIRQFKAFIETRYGIPVVVGTHPIPLNYQETHGALPFWDNADMREAAPLLFGESMDVMKSYD